MTLPLIYALNQATPDRRKWLINSVKNHNKDRKRVREVIQYVKDSGGLEYAEKKMLEFRDLAMEVLAAYPRSVYRESLELMVNYVVDRKI
mgnify:FL=1